MPTILFTLCHNATLALAPVYPELVVGWGSCDRRLRVVSAAGENRSVNMSKIPAPSRHVRPALSVTPTLAMNSSCFFLRRKMRQAVLPAFVAFCVHQNNLPALPKSAIPLPNALELYVRYLIFPLPRGLKALNTLGAISVNDNIPGCLLQSKKNSIGLYVTGLASGSAATNQVDAGQQGCLSSYSSKPCFRINVGAVHINILYRIPVPIRRFNKPYRMAS